MSTNPDVRAFAEQVARGGGQGEARPTREAVGRGVRQGVHRQRGRVRQDRQRRARHRADSVGARVGDTIEWVYKDIVYHTATAKNGAFNVDVPAGKKARVVLKKAGDIDYFCEYHPNMSTAIKGRYSTRHGYRSDPSASRGRSSRWPACCPGSRSDSSLSACRRDAASASAVQESRYSPRSETIGSTRDARRAGR